MSNLLICVSFYEYIRCSVTLEEITDTYRSATNTGSTSRANRSSLTLNGRETISKKQFKHQHKIRNLSSSLYIPWHRWVHLGQGDQ